VNVVTFGAKRAFQGFLHTTRKPFASVGLTAARFDLLYALDRHAPRHQSSRGALEQSQLWRLLGVSPQVVSRMLASLEQLGLVTRRRAIEGEHDKRQRVVQLTALGLQRLREARVLLMRAVRRIVHEAICFGRHRDPGQRFFATDMLESYLHALRSHFDDTATLYFPWGHPDD
jgi:DNA-binding MarR family transcriptional regulator